MIVTGARGSGKTVLVKELDSLCKEVGARLRFRVHATATDLSARLGPTRNPFLPVPFRTLHGRLGFEERAGNRQG
jgi:hypothetical protein